MSAIKLESQLADLVWCISTGLRAGYSLRQVFERMAEEAPEPAASLSRGVLGDLEAGLDYETVFGNLHETWPSDQVSRLVNSLLSHRKREGNLPDLLEPLGGYFLKESGSDPAFYPVMRQQAEALHAEVPERAK